MITKPHLPIRNGYIEVESEMGREYLKIETDEQKSIEKLREENELLKAQLQAQTDRSDFIEDCMAELAIQAYQ